MGQITEERKNKLISDLNQKGIIEDYQGIMYELEPVVLSSKYRKTRLDDDYSKISSDLSKDKAIEFYNKVRNSSLNPREQYYFFIKQGAPRIFFDLLTGKDIEITSESKIDVTEKTEKYVTAKEDGKITPKSVKEATSKVRMGEFTEGMDTLSNVTEQKESGKNGVSNSDGARKNGEDD